MPEAPARALRNLAVLRCAGKSLRLDQPADGYKKITSTSFGQIFVLGVSFELSCPGSSARIVAQRPIIFSSFSG